MRGRFCLLVFVATLTNIRTYEFDTWDSESEMDQTGFDLRLVRATANTLYVKAICNNTCSRIEWEYSSHHFIWSSGMGKIHSEELENDVFALRHLMPSTYYFVKAKMGNARANLRALTCPSGLEPLRKLQVRTSGPGWLDIRWEPPQFHMERCHSDIVYATRYKVEGFPGSKFSNYTMYGVYPVDDKGTLRGGPTHPCQEWPKEFCLLLTENIIAGMNYTVEIQPSRLWGDKLEVGQIQTIEGYANPHVRQGYGHFGIHPECVMWAWLSIGASIFSFAIVLVMLISTFVATIEKRELMEQEEIAENDEREGTETETETETAQ